MAKVRTRSSRTRNSISRASRWAAPSLARSRREATLPLPLSGVHRSQLGTILNDLDTLNSRYSHISRSSSSNRVRRVRLNPFPVLPALKSAADWLSPTHAAIGVPVAVKSVCEARKQRREVLAATGHFGSDHKIGSQKGVIKC